MLVGSVRYHLLGRRWWPAVEMLVGGIGEVSAFQVLSLHFYVLNEGVTNDATVLPKMIHQPYIVIGRVGLVRWRRGIADLGTEAFPMFFVGDILTVAILEGIDIRARSGMFFLCVGVGEGTQ